MSRSEEVRSAWNGLRLGDLLLSLGENLEREDLLSTPERLQRAWQEMLGGYAVDPCALLENALFENEGGSSPVICRDITFTSFCEHHVVPFFGHAHIAYQPNKSVIGLSKLARLVKALSTRLQIQERMTHEICNTLFEVVEPAGVLVIVDGVHLCCKGRGVAQETMHFVTTATAGVVSPLMLELVKGAIK